MSQVDNHNTQQAPTVEHQIMKNLIRTKDWSDTILGEPSTWPRSLSVALDIILHSGYPMFIWWGPELIMFHNDAYLPVLGQKHPDALGKSAREVWSEIWGQIGGVVDNVFQGETFYAQDLLMYLARKGFIEETYWTFSYSPFYNDDGQVGGLFCACNEESEKIHRQRRLNSIKNISALSAHNQDIESLCRATVAALENNPRDILFSALYFIDNDGADARKIAEGVLAGNQEELFPDYMSLRGAQSNGRWDISSVLEQRKVQVVQDLKMDWNSFPDVEYLAVNTAVIIPLLKPGQEELTGLLICGLSPYLEINDEYINYLELAAAQISTAIADVRSFEEERRRTQALEEIDRAKTIFFSNVSHEFRTPLTLLLNPVEEALAGNTGNHPNRLIDRTDLELVYRNALRLQKLVNNLLDFSRIEAGRIEARFVLTELDRFTTGLVSNFESILANAGLELDIQIQKTSPVYLDRDMWEKIVLNLLSNAYNHTLTGSIKVAVTEQDHHVMFSITDTGVGIAEKHISQIFDRFHRVQGPKARTYEGTGIGLSLVKKLVEIHHGEIGVSSELGQGTHFYIMIPKGKEHLPADKIAVADDGWQHYNRSGSFIATIQPWKETDSQFDVSDFYAETTILPSSISHTDQKERPHILVADDNSDMREYLTRLLSPHFQVSAVEHGLQALAFLEKNKIDLVLSDIMMPEMDGLTLLSTLKSDPTYRHLPFTLLSARAGEEARVEGLQQGADDYLTKPFLGRELIARIEARIEISRLRYQAELEEKAHAERFRNMADTVPIMIWVTDAEGRCTYLNKQWYDFSGQTESEGLGFGWLNAVHPEDAAISKETFLKANREQVAFSINYRLKNKSGDYLWHIDSGHPKFDEAGKFEGFIGAVFDMNERKLAEEQKNDFLRIAGHELRTPLTSLAGYLGLLQRTVPEEKKAQSLLEKCLQSTIKMRGLISDFLDIARVERGELAFKMEKIDLSVLTVELAEMWKLNAAPDHLKLSIAPHLYIYGDKERLEQVIMNLLSNAQKYSAQQEVIEIELTGTEAEVIMQVKDEGIGMEQQEVDKIFQKFYRIESGSRVKGMGLGLYIVKKIVDHHNGIIQVESSPGEGTCIIIKFPAVSN